MSGNLYVDMFKTHQKEETAIILMSGMIEIGDVTRTKICGVGTPKATAGRIEEAMLESLREVK